MRDRLLIGQTWRRRRDRFEAVVVQIHRADRTAELKGTDPAGVIVRLQVGFSELRLYWRQVGS